MYIKFQILKAVFIFFCLFFSFFITGYTTEKTGSLRVITDTPDVKIYINRELEGLAHPQKPLIRQYLMPGTIIVTAKPKNFPSISKSVVISAGNLSELVFKFNLKVSDKKENILKISEPALSGFSLEQLITQGDKYFQNQRYMIPEHENAFEMYKAALQIAPDNDHSRKKIYEMLKIYEFLGIESENKNYEKALIYYQNYIVILKYCLNTFQAVDLKELLEQTQKKVNELKNNIELSNKLAKKGDSYFIAQKFTTPKNKNAFLLYKASLESNPTNEYSLKRIKEILKIYKKQGDQAFQKGFYKKAGKYYNRYLRVAEYVLEKFKSNRIKRELKKIKKRIKKI